MNESHAAAEFTQATMRTYIQLYVAFVTAKDDNIEFVNGPQFDKEDWIGRLNALPHSKAVMEFLYPISSETTDFALLSPLLPYAKPKYSGTHALLGPTLTLTISVCGLI